MPNTAEEIRAAVEDGCLQVVCFPDPETKFPVGPARAPTWLAHDRQEDRCPAFAVTKCGVGNGKFALSFMRHTGEWVRIYDALTVDECLKAIQDDPWFVP